MKTTVIAGGVVLLALIGTYASAQTSYDASKELSVAGTVRYVLSAASADGTVGVHLEVTTPTGPVRVALAPAMFIATNNYYFFTEEQVYVVGAKVGKNGEVWARTISKDGKNFLVLRDEDGTPRWPRATADDPDGCGVSHDPIR